MRDLPHPRHDPGWRYRVSNSRPDPSVRGGQERTSESSVVSLAKETEPERRASGVGPLRSTKEAGELEPWEPRGGKGKRVGSRTRYGRTVMEPLEGNMTDSLKFGTVYPQQRRIANTAQNHHRTSRMLEICQSGICGRPGRATARVDPAVGVWKQRAVHCSRQSDSPARRARGVRSQLW